MSNPFENESGSFLVLINEEKQYSLWPSFVDVPAGWSTIHGPATKTICVTFIETNWTDMRPNSLIQKMPSEVSPSFRMQ